MAVIAAVASFLTGAITLGSVWSAALVVATVGGIYSFGRDIATAAKSRPGRFSGQLSSTPHLGLEFWQDGETVPMTLQTLGSGKDAVVTHLRRAPFQLKIPHYSAYMQMYVAAWSDDTIFSLDNKQTTADVEFLHAGTGMAVYRSTNAFLALRHDAHGHFTGERIWHTPDNKAEIVFDSVWRPGLTEPASLATEEGDIFVTIYIDQGAEKGLAEVQSPRDYYSQAHPLRTSPSQPWYEYVILRFH
jgi:hypothetical protein